MQRIKQLRDAKAKRTITPDEVDELKKLEDEAEKKGASKPGT
jgi:hypothetical protein